MHELLLRAIRKRVRASDPVTICVPALAPFRIWGGACIFGKGKGNGIDGNGIDGNGIDGNGIDNKPCLQTLQKMLSFFISYGFCAWIFWSARGGKV